MLKKIMVILLIFAIANGSEEIVNRGLKKNGKENVLQVVTHITAIQGIISEYLDVHDNVKKKWKNVSYMTVIPNSKYIAVLGFGSLQNYIHLYEFKNGAFTLGEYYELGTKAKAIIAHPNGKEIIFIRDEEEDAINTLNLESKNISPLPIENFGGALAISTTGRLIAASSSWGYMKLWSWGDTDERAIRVRLKPEYTRPNSLAFSPDGEKLAIGTHNGFSMGNIKIYDLETEEITDLPNSYMHNEVSKMAFSPNGKFLAACASRLKNIMIWNFKTQQLIHTSQTDATNIVGFSSDNKYLITSLDNEHYIWSNQAEELNSEESDNVKAKKN